MPPAPKIGGDEEVANGVPLDESMIVETGRPPLAEQADPVIKPSLKKRPWYRRPRILYTIAIIIIIISLALATVAILWATGVVNIGSTAQTSAAAGSTTEGNDGSTPAQEPPVDINIPSPPPQENPGEQGASPTEPSATDGGAPLPTATPIATEPQRTDPLSFYVMGDVPYASWEEIVLGTQIADMRSSAVPGAEFVVHVGDMQIAQRTGCSLDHFYKIGNILLSVPLPTFVLVGDNDYLDCPDVDGALAYYRNTFVGFEGNWTHSLDVVRWTTPETVPMEYDITRTVANPEYFAFMRDGILFMSFTILNMNIGQGEAPDDLFYERLEDSTAWVEKQLNDYKSQGIRGVVLFSHAKPSPDIRPFFENLKTVFVDNAGVYSPVLYIHGDGHDFGINTEMGVKLGWTQFTRVEVDQGAYADPILITVAPDEGGISTPLTADDSGLQHALGGGLFLLDRQEGRYPDSIKEQYGG